MYFNKQFRQAQSTEEIFRQADFVPSSATIIAKAKILSATYGLAGMDALHAASAIVVGAEELVTFEKPEKPFFRIPATEVRVVSLYG
jgi:predicted nucleic acid-binding protein